MNYSGESNPIINKAAFQAVMESVERSVDWNDPELDKVVRLRLLTDRDFPAWDVSYCVGRTKSGEYVDVNLPFHQLPKGRGQIQRAILAYAKKDGVFAKGLGLFDGDVVSTFR